MAQVGAGTASPMTLLREHAEAVRRLLHAETVSVRGRYVRLDAVELDRPPEQVPPLIIGARWPQAVALAGAVGDGVLLDRRLNTLRFPEYVASAAARVAEAARSASRPVPQVIALADISPDVPAIGDRARELIGELAGAGATSVVLQCISRDPTRVP